MRVICRAVVTAAAIAAAAVPVRGQGDQLVGEARTHVVVAGESLASIAARAGLPVETLARDNGQRRDTRLRPMQELRVDNRHVVPDVGGSGIVINVPQRMLFLLEDGRALAAYPVAAGQPDWRTPVGSFHVSAKEVDPTWDVPLSIQREMARQGKRVLTKVAAGPQNPLGDRWIAVGETGIGIHGTNAPSSIYRLSTHGCIRLHPDDIRDLFDRVDVGTPIRIIYEPVLVASGPSGTWVEVHPDAYRLMGPPLDQAVPLLPPPLTEETLDRVRECVEQRAGRACRIAGDAQGSR